MRTVLQIHMHLRRLTRELRDGGVTVSAALLSGEGDHQPGTSETSLRRIAQAQALYDAVRSAVEAIEQLGAEVKDIESGLIDFYSLRDGTQEVLLCWRLGEREITHYHDLQSGFSGRQPVEGHDFIASPR